MKIYDFYVKDRNGKEINLDQYKGKVLLIINSATQCGFTPQYGDLQKLYDNYSNQGFAILDFPCNQFGNQAPGTVDEIQSFCELNFGVTFPIHSKIEVNGVNAHPLYKFLKDKHGFGGFDSEHPIASKLVEILSKEDPNYQNTSDIKWNFTKFLVDREGNVLERFEPTKDIKIIEKRIRELL
ncbi:MAG: glutathione peroxidase [Clostridiales bacterium]|nr:glutathione peroxidase [Clostridiales bacterium]